MNLMETIQSHLVDAMKARNELRLSTLRMIKTALKNKEVDKMGALTDAEAIQVLSTLVKQRRDSMEQFSKGGRPELAEKEAAEITIIEAYMPKAIAEEEIRATVRAAMAEMGTPTFREMGQVMKNVMARFQAQSARVEGKIVSEIVKQELSRA